MEERILSSRLVFLGAIVPSPQSGVRMTLHEPVLRTPGARARVRRLAVLPLLPLLPLLLVTTAVTGCGRVPGQFEILQNQVPQAGCVIPADEGNLYRGQGVLDLQLVRPGSTSAYFVFPLVKNNLPGATGEGPDGNEIDVSSFAVDIMASRQGTMPARVQDLFDSLNGAAGSADYALLHYSLPWAVTIRSGGGTAATLVGAFPVDLASRILATGDVGVSPQSLLLNLRIRVFGSTNTQDMESDPFDFPLYVCAGCLIGNLLPCPFAGAANTGNECNVAQDNVVDCCSLNDQLICPPLVGSQ
jgi:hypothetical protein